MGGERFFRDDCLPSPFMVFSMIYPTRNHPSRYHDQKIVYPVVSRRAGGVSIGVNLSPSKRCNFGCVYCQVHIDRTRESERLAQVSPYLDLDRLDRELSDTVATVKNGALFTEARFAATPQSKRELKDFAFSGDGEPTLSPQFVEASEILARRRSAERLDALKLVLITNATTLRETRTIAGCDILAANNGEIWVKLDGGTPSDYQAMNRSAVPFETICENIAFAGRRWPVAIQTMLLRKNGSSPSERQILDYCRAVAQIREQGGEISRILLYTVARAPFESGCESLSNAEMDAFSQIINENTSIPVAPFYSK